MSCALPTEYSVPSARAIAEQLLPAYQLAGPVRCRLWRSGVNTTYVVDAGSGRHFLRIPRASRRTRSEVAYEVDVLRHLGARDVPVALPVPRHDGEYITAVSAPEGMRYATLFKGAAGKRLPTDAAMAQELGQTAAHAHEALRSFSSRHARSPIDLAFVIERPLEALRANMSHRPADWRYIYRIATTLHARLAEAADRLELGVCHGDLHAGNCHRRTDGGVTLFDFDDCGPGYVAYDLGVFCWTVRKEGSPDGFWQAFLEGYRQARPLREADARAVPLFAMARQVWFIGHMMGLSADWHGWGYTDDLNLDRWLRDLRSWAAEYLPGESGERGESDAR